ncbi:MAG: 2-amino-4-hydroxy-6-hydroxymethyldihydropteridine diphosphokinase [Phycisphaerales bacterium]
MDSSRGTLAAIALGSNVGDRQAHLARALVELAGLPRSRVLVRSAIIQTNAEPIEPGVAVTAAALGGPYLNGAAVVKTLLDPAALLEALLGIERRMGRVRDAAHRAAPRTIDLDLLTFGDAVLDSEYLCLPHPRLHQREFVLAPLAQIAPRLLVPGTNGHPPHTVADLLADVRARRSGGEP